jgi:hypothetical protein
MKLGLVVKKSGIVNAGLGLFAARNFEIGDIICVYYGELLTKEALDDRYGDATGPYSMQSGQSAMVVDGACLRSPAVYANDLSNSSSRRPAASEYNAEFTDVDAANIDEVYGQGISSLAGTVVCLVATKRITASNDRLVEIHVDYGDTYWGSDVEYTHRTKRKRKRGAMELSAERNQFSPHSLQSPRRSLDGSNTAKKRTKSKTSKKSKTSASNKKKSKKNTRKKSKKNTKKKGTKKKSASKKSQKPHR